MKCQALISRKSTLKIIWMKCHPCLKIVWKQSEWNVKPMVTTWRKCHALSSRKKIKAILTELSTLFQGINYEDHLTEMPNLFIRKNVWRRQFQCNVIFFKKKKKKKKKKYFGESLKYQALLKEKKMQYEWNVKPCFPKTHFWDHFNEMSGPVFQEEIIEIY